MDNKVVELGTFEVVSGKLIVSDPGYRDCSRLTNKLNNVMCGAWHAEIALADDDSMFPSIERLSAYLSSYSPQDAQAETDPIQVCVDSGQAGIFDAQYYRDGDAIAKAIGIPNGDADMWYQHCCEITLSRQQAGIIPYGAVSRSGMGDGTYECILHRSKAGSIVRVDIRYMEDADEQEDA